MTCYHPLHAFETGQLTANGKKEIIVTSHFKDALPISYVIKKFGHDYKYDSEHMAVVGQSICLVHPVDVPCGHCIGCRLDRSSDWATRCALEATLYPENFFVTLTYDCDHLPKDGKVSKEEMSRFMKRLRKEYGNGIRFFGCGEYGSKGLRPHYHIILFNIHLDDLRAFSKSDVGDRYYVSERLSRIWSKGFVLVGDVTWRSAAYVARYSCKKIGERGEFEPFLLMSRNPGIGHDWIEKNYLKVFNTDKIYYDFGDRKLTPSNRYFDGYLEKLHPELLEGLKDVRAIRSEMSQTANEVRYETDHDGLLDKLEKEKKRSFERLKRNKV